MARYNPYDYDQTRLLPVCLEHQLLQGTLAPAIHVLVENRMDLSIFACRYKTDETGSTAYDPKILLKVVLFAYSHGFVGSRRIEWLCANHVTCMALAGMQCPDHSTIAAFVSSMRAEIFSLFCDLLLVCEEQELLGGTVFALDGLKLSSNASKEWSGTVEVLQPKQAKLEAKIDQLLAEHQQIDAGESHGKGLPAKAHQASEMPNDESLSDKPSKEISSPAEEAQCDESGLTQAPPEDSFEAEGQGISEAEEAQRDESELPQAKPEDSFKTEGQGTSEAEKAQRDESGLTQAPPEDSFEAEGQGTSESLTEIGEQARQHSVQESGKQRWSERLKRLRRHAERIKNWLAHNEAKIGRQGKEMKSNITDNASAKMSTSHGVIQGYNAQAVVDDKHQVIVGAEAFGDGQDGQHLSLVMPRLKENMKAIGHGEDFFEGKQVLADSNYFSDTNLNTCEDEKLDAYIPDCNFRKRDPRFADQKRYKPQKKKSKKTRFGVDDFTYDEATQCYRCPNGKLLRLKVREHRVKHRVYRRYVTDEKDCRECPFRTTGLSQKKTKRKHLGIPVEEPVTTPKSRYQKMIEKIDTPEGKQQYSRRLAIVEPVFASIRTQKGLDHFTLRGKEKVDIQWTLYAMVHNIEKIANYGGVA